MRFILFVILTFTFVADAALVYQPRKAKGKRLVVAIHGCLQSAESMAFGTGWNALAEREGFYVLYPQARGSHPLGCWSWYLPANQTPESGELKEVMDEIAQAQRQFGLMEGSVYLAGISSGAATVAGLLACFPDRFRAAALHSGLSYGLASSAQEAERVLAQGPPAKPVSAPCRPRNYQGGILVLHGDADQRVNPAHRLRLIQDFVSDTVASAPQLFSGGSIRYGKVLNYSVTDYFRGRDLRGRLIDIAQLEHAWAGYVLNLRYVEFLNDKTRVPFFSAEGPSATDLMWNFLSKY